MKKGMFVVLMVIAVLMFSAACTRPVAKVRNGLSHDSMTVLYDRITVDYSQTVEQMITNTGCTSMDGINTDNFPVSGKGKIKILPVLIHLDRDIASNDEVLAEMNSHNLRPATLPELLAFAAAYPSLQRLTPIIALGSVWQEPELGELVPFIWSFNNERVLLLSQSSDGWIEQVSFLAVIK